MRFAFLAARNTAIERTAIIAGVIRNRTVFFVMPAIISPILPQKSAGTMVKYCMRRIAAITVLNACFALSFGQDAQAFAKKDAQECVKCHTLKQDQAKDILKSVLPDPKILYVKVSPLTGLWELGVDAGGRKGIIYLDYSLTYIVSPMTGGNLFDIKTKNNLTDQAFRKINKVDRSQIPLGDALVMGDKNAKHKVIVFDDPD